MWRLRRYAPRLRSPGYDLRRAPSSHPHFAGNAIRGGLNQRSLSEFEQFNVSGITRPERYLLLVQTGDEVLDYRQAVKKYCGARQIVIEGGDHGFRSFSDHVPVILEFAAEERSQPGAKRPGV
jgi:predicted esterase YcpF (UPF0227 family)